MTLAVAMQQMGCQGTSYGFPSNKIINDMAKLREHHSGIIHIKYYIKTILMIINRHACHSLASM